MPAADVCLVSNPSLGRARSTIVPHWILWLAGHLERQGYGVDIVDVKCPVNAPGTPQEEERLLSETLARRDYLMAGGFGIADVYLFTVLRWTAGFAIDLNRWPALAGFQARIDQRPAVKAALAAELA